MPPRPQRRSRNTAVGSRSFISLKEYFSQIPEPMRPTSSLFRPRRLPRLVEDVAKPQPHTPQRSSEEVETPAQQPSASPSQRPDWVEGEIVTCDSPEGWNDKYKRMIKNTKRPAVVEFTSSWSGPCLFINSFIQRQAKEHKDVMFIQVDNDKVDEEDVNVAPTFLLYKDGEKKDKVVGAKEDELRQKILHLKDNPT